MEYDPMFTVLCVYNYGRSLILLHVTKQFLLSVKQDRHICNDVARKMLCISFSQKSDTNSTAYTKTVPIHVI